VYQNVDATILLGDLTNRIGSILRIGGIRLNSKGLRAICLQFRDHFFGRFPVSGVGNGNIRAVGGQALGDRGADAARTAGNKGSLPRQSLRHLRSPWLIGSPTQTHWSASVGCTSTCPQEIGSNQTARPEIVRNLAGPGELCWLRFGEVARRSIMQQLSVMIACKVATGNGRPRSLLPRPALSVAFAITLGKMAEDRHTRTLCGQPRMGYNRHYDREPWRGDRRCFRTPKSQPECSLGRSHGGAD
jgi:hypothetical protein